MGAVTNLLNKALNKFNVQVEIKGLYKFDGEKAGYVYEKVVPNASYAPWSIDKGFQEIYGKIKAYTLVDIYRCYEIWKLIEECIKVNPKDSFIEIGVWRGGTGAIIAQRLKDANLNTNLFLADTFTGIAKASEHDSGFVGGEYADTSKELVQKMIDDAVGYKNVTLLKGIFPEDTANLINDDIRFQFCHIDVDVYLSAKGVVDWVWHRMPVGGVILYDDYGFYGCDGITKFVEEERKKSDRIVIHNLNGHAIVIKIK